MPTNKEIVEGVESVYDSYILVAVKLRDDNGAPMEAPYLAMRGNVTLLAQMLLYAHATVATSAQKKLEEMEKETTEGEQHV